MEGTENPIACRFTLSGLQNKGNSLPSWVVDPQRRCGKSRANRITWDGLIVQVSGLAICCDVLSQQGIVSLNRGDGAKNFDLVPSISIRFLMTCHRWSDDPSLPFHLEYPQQRKRRGAPWSEQTTPATDLGGKARFNTLRPPV